jgi:hypothetical protein
MNAGACDSIVAGTPLAPPDRTMKKQYDAKKLRLSRESLRTLTLVQLEDAAGGIRTTSKGATCESACLVGCVSVVGC